MVITAEVGTYLLELARREIRARLRRVMAADELVEPEDKVLHQPAGCFVSLHSHSTRELRGCIGRLEAQWPLGEVVAKMARSVLDDPRFVDDPVQVDELADLEIEISILTPPRRLNRPEEFDLLNDGICMSLEERRGLFLPQVARETGWNRQQLLERLCREKMGLPADAWRDPRARFEAFTIIILGPERF